MVLTLVLSSFVGSVVGLGLIAAGRGSMKYALPYGTFLAAAAVASSFFGDRLIAWYAGFYS